ncbi:MAG: hypothetical protein QM796_11020 [Chthoniobacteraceae bacterium]
MKRTEFITQLGELGFEPKKCVVDGFIEFSFTIPIGKFAGQKIQLALQVMDLNPPGGPHISPHLLPINTQSLPHPVGGIHNSPLGAAWQYWSRPFSGWAQSDRSAKTYMAHINKLFDTQ